MEIAEAYVNHVWTPTDENVFHGIHDGWTIDTPDDSWWMNGGWWIPDQENIGVPYQWGGFSSISGFNLVNPEDFDDQYRGEGRFAGNIHYAGDIYCDNAKIEGTKACGVDCSGFVSRCWNLPSKHNTAVGEYGLIHESWPIAFENLKEGDILLRPSGDRHVMLFKRFLTPQKTQIEVYEASAWDWKVSERVYDCVVNDQPYWAYDRKNQGYVQASGKGHGVALTHDGITRQYWAYSHIRPILFDDTHDEDNDDIVGQDPNYGQLKATLEEEGYVINELDTGSITYDVLREYGILILPDIEKELSNNEVKDMIKFLNGDGRILIIGEWKGAHLPESASKISVAAGIRFDDTIVKDPDDYILQDPVRPIIHSIATSHDIGKGISEFVIYRGSSLTLTDSRARAIAWGDSDTYVVDPIGDGTLPDDGNEDMESSGPHSSTIIVLAASSYTVSGGEARLVCIGDSDLWKNGNNYEWFTYNPIEDYDNKKLLVNVINWLSALVLPPATQPPGFGMISRGEVIASSISIVEGAPELKVVLSWPGSDLDLGVEDPSGRRVGYNPEAEQVVNEIPGAEYSGIGAKPEWIRIPNPEPGEWTISVYGRDVSGDYEIYRIDVPDTFPPAAVTDLATVDYTLGSISLVWTSPGDDGNRGTASTYDIRYSTDPITEGDGWDKALRCEGEPTPQPAGSVEAFTVTGLEPSSTYYFALKSADGVPNWSGLSNGAVGKTTVLASVDFDPETLNLKSKGKWVTAHVGLPEGYDVRKIDTSSILLNGVVHAFDKIDDCDRDGVHDLIVKFDRASVIELFAGKKVPDDYVVEVGGLVAGIRFVGTDTIKVISPGKKDK